jgi:hypothetical protein
MKTLASLDSAHSRCRVRFDHENLHGYRSNGFTVWFRWEQANGCYLRCGSTNYPKGAKVRINSASF